MFEFMIRVSQLALPVFIFSTMANVGLTQDPKRVVRYWGDWPFYLNVLLANFVAAPLVMVLFLQIWPLPDQQMAGLFIFSLCAGAPFLIKLTATSEHDVALGAATMMILVLATIVIVPILLPLLLQRLSVDGGALAWTLVRQLLLPILLGALLAWRLPDLAGRLQPWIAKAGNLTLYVVLAATLIGYFPQIAPIVRSGALVLGVLFVLAAFALGYVAGYGRDDLEDIAGLATAQRNTAAAMLIATSSFSDPTAFLLVNLVNTLGIIALLVVAKLLKGDNVQVAPL